MHSKAQFQIFDNPLTAPRTVSNAYAQVVRAQSCVNHTQHIKRLSRATRRVTCHMVQRDSSAIKFDNSGNCIYFSFILLAEPLNWWRRGGSQSTRRKPLATSLRKCHILQPEDWSPKRDSNPHNSIGGREGKPMCQPLHHALPPLLSLPVLHIGCTLHIMWTIKAQRYSEISTC